ncbi:MAG: PilZ domain-containing protein [Deltaproteobacteria bacterium]|nr:PilZ domain-containing protein [Deltaproteobacteria bacterium]
MPTLKKVMGVGAGTASWASAFKECGIDFKSHNSVDEALKSEADCILLDARQAHWVSEIPKLKAKTSATILSLIKDSFNRDDLLKLKNQGSEGYVSESTPAEEVVIRVRALLDNPPKEMKEARAAKRIWFQQKVDFKAFDKPQQAWSTTLSETGIFLRTNLTFPLYSVIQLKFNLLGQNEPFACDGVIVRQEVEGDIHGLGIMFQNLKGESVRALESFLEIYR